MKSIFLKTIVSRMHFLLMKFISRYLFPIKTAQRVILVVIEAIIEC